MTRPNPRLEAALALARSGAALLPVRWTDARGICSCSAGPNCTHPGKHPLTEHGLTDATTDFNQVTKWWQDWPRANIGERTDRHPRIDIDLPDVAEQIGADIPLRTQTPMVRTTRPGLHITLATRQPVPSQVLYLSDGRRLGELKAAGAYVVVPPSRIGTRDYEVISVEGVEPLLVDDPIAWLRDLLPCFGLALADKPPAKDYERLGGVIDEGEGRHNALVSYAGKIWVEGMTPEGFCGAMQAVNDAQCRPPLPDDKLDSIVQHFMLRREPRQGSPVTGGSYRLTDVGNAELFADLYADRLSYDHRRKRWLLWQGQWWADDTDGEHQRLAVAAVRERYRQAVEIADLEERTKASRFAIQSEGRQRLDALLTIAQSQRRLADAGEHWDEDPFLLGVTNGVVDLRTGCLRDGRPEDRITLHTDIPYLSDARAPRWDRFLHEVFEGDGELIDYIHRAVGYSLTGDTSEQDIFTCFGKGGNGKSVFLNVLGLLAGRYGWNAPFTTFEAGSKYAIPNDIAALVNVRLVTSSETNEDARLNEARLKSLTGGDVMTARFLHGEFFKFRPVAKIWLAVNHRPRVSDDSEGFWRRLKLIPFLHQFKSGRDADPYLMSTLIAELPGILTWTVRGCLAWQQRRLAAPRVVTAATQQYREDADPLSQFLADACVVQQGAFAGAADLYRCYVAWCLDHGVVAPERLTSTAFGLKMSNRFEKRKTKRGTVYFGVGDDGTDYGAATPPEDLEATG